MSHPHFWTLTKRLLPGIFFSIAMTGSLSAASVLLQITDSPSNPRFLTDGQGVPLAGGSVIRIGTFDLGPGGANLPTISTSTDFSVVDSFFTPLAEDGVGAGTIDQAPPAAINPANVLAVNGQNGPGTAVGQIQFITTPPPEFISGVTRLFLWVFDSNDISAVTPGDWGIFTAPTNPGWIFQGGEFGFTILAGSDVTPDGVIRGQVNLTELKVAPEPSAVFFIGIAGVIALLSRRRIG